jgi:hypothetical protein
MSPTMSEDAPWDFAWGFDPDNDPPFEKVPGWREFRRKARMNTYTVIGSTMSIEDYPDTRSRFRTKL